MRDTYGKTDLEFEKFTGLFLFSGDDVDKKLKVLSGVKRVSNLANNRKQS
jgi:ATPase subunit of ABC transporter with duplicated ATPase domains